MIILLCGILAVIGWIGLLTTRHNDFLQGFFNIELVIVYFVLACISSSAGDTLSLILDIVVVFLLGIIMGLKMADW